MWVSFGINVGLIWVESGSFSGNSDGMHTRGSTLSWRARGLHMYVYVHVCVYIYIYTCTCINLHTYICTCTWIYMFISTHDYSY